MKEKSDNVIWNIQHKFLTVLRIKVPRKDTFRKEVTIQLELDI